MCRSDEPYSHFVLYSQFSRERRLFRWFSRRKQNKNYTVGLYEDITEQISFKLLVMVHFLQLCCLILVWMAFAVIQGHLDERKFNNLHCFPGRCLNNFTNLFLLPHEEHVGQLTWLCAVFSNSFLEWPLLYISALVSLHQVFLGLPCFPSPLDSSLESVWWCCWQVSWWCGQSNPTFFSWSVRTLVPNLLSSTDYCCVSSLASRYKWSCADSWWKSGACGVLR